MPNSNLSQLCSFEDNESAFIIHFLMLFLLRWKNDAILKGKTSSADDSLFLEVPIHGTREKAWWKYSSISSSLPLQTIQNFHFLLVATTQLCPCSHRLQINARGQVCVQKLNLKQNKRPAFRVQFEDIRLKDEGSGNNWWYFLEEIGVPTFYSWIYFIFF